MKQLRGLALFAFEGRWIPTIAEQGLPEQIDETCFEHPWISKVVAEMRACIDAWGEIDAFALGAWLRSRGWTDVECEAALEYAANGSAFPEAMTPHYVGVLRSLKAERTESNRHSKLIKTVEAMREAGQTITGDMAANELAAKRALMKRGKR